jgi:hypothetical protein
MAGFTAAAATPSPSLSAAAPASLPVETLAATVASGAVSKTSIRKYRVHATITLLGLSIYTRKDVGSGFATVERIEADGKELTSFQFAAGSIPERAKGLNRTGFFHEIVARPTASKENAAYFGFMTHSPENNLDQAKASMAKQNGAVLFKAISGTADSGRADATVYTVDAPNAVQWPRWRELTSHIRTHLPAAGQQQSAAISAGTRTFLRAIYEGLQSPQRKLSVPVVYSGKLYTLAMSKAADGPRTRVDGSMEYKGDKSPFKLWYGNDPSGNLLPERIETKVRSFLRLNFEADASLDLPAPGKSIGSGAL